ncbi:hypothetical protein AAIH70_05420 [Neorhizobium sp. BT27B]|jgi:predicted DNA-binding protein|uniref:hypothetical protein n=1 Tax=Neorhizobium sp. BT27B TaxID=3142625 RepID=UPI003D2E511B
MGRPPLNVEETKVRLSPETRARIKALVGNYQVAAFIREAIEKELRLREANKGDPGTSAEQEE